MKEYVETEKLRCPLLHKGGTWPARKRKRQIDFSAFVLPLVPKKYLEMPRIPKEEFKDSIEL